MKHDKLKICMLGATRVGKTSLVTRYTKSAFSDEYLMTIGVKIETRRIDFRGQVVDLVLWDLSGEDQFQSVQPTYLRGAAGYFLVIDGTRRETVDTAILLHTRVREVVPRAPFVVLLNKADLVVQWEIGLAQMETLRGRGWKLIDTSAKTGAGVDEGFRTLLGEIFERREHRMHHRS